ncbi:MAG TPA: hypothetical protein VMC41_01120 [Candidatus Nanoarchaeia archaeon]|nr:hypothetical protein [Candidatus Nanoarchaeia archaeon]
MLEYLEKFNNLPDEVKQKISSGAVLGVIEELEGEYGVNLATFVMRVMVGDLYYKNLTANLIIEFDLKPEVAARLAADLNAKVFSEAMDYLSAAKAPQAAAPVEEVSPFFGSRAAVPPAENAAAPAIKPISPIVRRAPAVAKPPANFLEEDKSDIAAMGKITSALKSVPQEKIQLLPQEIIKEERLGFASDNLRKRFGEILLSYLRGVRTKVEVRENLLKAVASGGVAMSPADADRVLNVAQKKLNVDEEKFAAGPVKVTAKSGSGGTNFIFNENEIKQALAQRVNPSAAKPADLSSSVRDVGYDLSALKNRPAPAAVPVPVSPAAPAQAISAAKKEAVLEEKLAAPAPVKTMDIPPSAPKIQAAAETAVSRNDETKRAAAVVGNKKRMEDIKPAPRIMSPIDELAYMDLVSFRRLDPSPAARVGKLEEKIALLEKEGIDKKIEGIRAWRLNPVSKTYLAMGQESIGSGKSIDDIIKERKDQGLNYLSREEFEAVMDLNNNLRF